jgi:chaperonin GroES
MNEGSVVAVGPGRRSLNGDLIPVGVKEGDKVLLPEFGGIPVKLGEESSEGPQYFVFRDEELLGVLTE